MGTRRAPIALAALLQTALLVTVPSGVGLGRAFVADSDADGIPDASDNCSGISNADQIDANADGYGNVCDTDYDDNGSVGMSDFNALREAFGAVAGEPSYDPGGGHPAGLEPTPRRALP